MTSRLFSLAILALVGALHGCGDSEGDGPAKADFTVVVKNYSFTPDNLTIKPGQTVEWVFQQGTHDVVSGSKAGDVCTPDGTFKSGDPQSTGTYRHKFDAAGTFPYFCSPHCANNQIGKVVVAP